MIGKKKSNSIKLPTPQYTMEDLKKADDPIIFTRANAIFEEGRVDRLRPLYNGYAASVRGTQTYEVELSPRRVDEGSCTCPMGREEKLCKHIIAVAVAVINQNDA